MKKMFLPVLLLSGAMSFGQLYADVTLTDDDGEKKIQIGGNGYMMFGQLVSGHSYQVQGAQEKSKTWMNNYSGRIDITSMPVEWFRSKISLEIASSWPLDRESTIMKDLFKQSFKVNLPQVAGIFDFDFDFMSLMIESGYMEYAFNTQVKNLGNYLYRSQAYPLYMTTKLDDIYSHLLGIRFETGFLDNNLKVGAMMHSTTERPPYFDMNLGLFASYIMPNKFADVGFGIVFDRMIAMDKKRTDLKSVSDTTITLRATKLDLRVTLDPKVLFPDIEIFGENDLKVYGEGAVLGTKDPDYWPIDPEYPDPENDNRFPRPDLLHRMPIMFGINVPTFKALDYFTFEIEFCKYPYGFDWWGIGDPSPEPIKPTDDKWVDIYRNKDNIKWTLYAKKSISNFDIIALFGNDHMNYGTPSEGQFNPEQSLRKNWDWHWYLKLQYNL